MGYAQKPLIFFLFLGDSMYKTYKLDGFIVVTDWYGEKGWVHMHIHTDEQGFKEIKENPLQDYLSFGVQSVDYALLDVYLKEIEDTDEYTLSKKYKDPIETIEAGDPTWVNEQDEDFLLMVWDSEPAVIRY